MPLALLADTECEDFEAALATNLVGPFRLTKALLGLLAARGARRRRRGSRSLVLNVSSDAAVTPYAGWGAYGASKAALAHLSRIWDEELRPHGVAVIAVDPGDMDTPLHALAVPDADPATLKRPRDAAREIVARIDRERARGGRGKHAMKAATLPIQRPRDARLLVVDADGRLTARARADLPALLAAGDLVVANDAATLPASLAGRHLPSGAAIELRLAGRRLARAPDDAHALSRRRLRRRRLPHPHRGPAARRRRWRRAIGSRSDRSRPRCCASSAIRAWSRSASPATPTR